MIITAPEDVTPAWLTPVVHRSGISRDTQVSAVEIILQRELPISTVCRLGISYEGAVDKNCPPSLFLKLPRVGTDAGQVLGVDDHAEVEFYRDIASRMSCPPLIRCYDAAYSEETKHSHLLLADLTETHSQPSQKESPSEETSRLAVKALATAHRAWWNSSISDLGFGISDVGADEDVRSVLAKRFDDEALHKFIIDLDASVTAFLGVADLAPAQDREYRRMRDAAGVIWGRMTRQEHLTITHGDMHWWNFLYPKDPGTDAVHIFDWHLWHIDLGARDLAFLLALGGFSEPRPSIEEDLLRVYHHALGIEDYSWEMLMEDYRWSAIRNLNIPVIFWKQGKHESTVRDALRRAYEAYERLECRSLL